jgi:hypothetical protein
MKKILSMLIAMVFAVGMVGNFPVTVRAATGSEPVVKEDNGATYITQYDESGNVLSKTLRLPSNAKLYIGSAGEIYFYNNNTHSKVENGITAFDVEDVVGEPTIYAKDGLLYGYKYGEFNDRNYDIHRYDYNYNSDYEEFENVLISCPINKSGEVVIADGTTLINSHAFSGCSLLTSVTIPMDTIISSNGAFWGCENLTIYGYTGSMAQYYAKNYDIPFVSIGKVDSGSPYKYEILYDGTARIVDYNGSDMEKLEIPSEINGYKVTEIGWGENGNFAFQNAYSLTSVTLPDSITDIGYNPFINCISLKEINVSKNNPNYTSIDGVLFDKKVTTIIAFPSGFEGDFTLPDSVTDIGYNPFNNCFSLKEINVSKNNPNYTSIDGSLFNKEITELIFVSKNMSGDYIIPDSVTTIGDDAFYGCKLLTSVTTPNSVTSIGYGVFTDCRSLTKINVDENNQNYASIDGVLFNKDFTEILVHPRGKT